VYTYVLLLVIVAPIRVWAEEVAMSRLARAEVFAPDEIAIVHVISRVVRRCFLLGDDPVSKKNFRTPDLGRSEFLG